MRQGEPNGLAELDLNGRVPSTQATRPEDQKTGEMTPGLVPYTDGAGGVVYGQAIGREYVTIERVTEASTSVSASFQSYQTLVVPNLPLGRYRIEWCAYVGSSNSGTPCDFQILKTPSALDITLNGRQNFLRVPIPIASTGSGDTAGVQVAGFRDFTNGVVENVTFTAGYKESTTGPSATAYAFMCRMTLIKVDD